MRRILGLLFVMLCCGAAPAQQLEVTYTEDFGSVASAGDPAGWMDGDGVYATAPDPRDARNVVYGAKHLAPKQRGVGRGAPGETPEDGAMATLGGRWFTVDRGFEYRGRFHRTTDESLLGLTFFSAQPEGDAHRMIALWRRAGESAPAMRLFGAAFDGVTDSRFTPDAGAWYRFAIRAEKSGGGVSIRARFWREDESEPQSWSIDATDRSAASLAGRIGIWSSVGASYVDDLSVAAATEVIEDRTGPAIVFSEAGSIVIGSAAFNRDARIDVRALDGSGVRSLSVTVDGGAYKPGDPIAAEGTHLLRAVAIDNKGNASEATLSVVVDKTRPAIVVTSGGAPLISGLLTNANVAPAFRAEDATAVTLTATLDGVPFIGGVVAGEGTHTLIVAAVDAVGWTSTATVTFTIDRTAPAIAFVESGITLTASAAFGRDAQLLVNADDPNGIETLTITDNGIPFTSGATIATEGTHALLARAVDKAGNEATATLSLLIDKTKPVITISNVIALTKNDVAPAFTVNDAGAVTVTATLDGAPFTSGSSVSAEGTHTLVVTATDAVGLSESATATFTIDRAAPSIAFVESGITLTASAAFGRDAQLLVSADDPNGIETLTITDNGTPFTSGATIATEGTHALLARAVDKAGNEATASLSLLIDKTKPVITISNVIALTKNDVAPAFTVSDAGAVTVTATLDGAPFTSGSSVSTEGTHTLSVTATDAVGLSESATATFTIDRTAPTIAFVESGITLTVSAAFGRDAQLVVSADDPNGIETLTITDNGAPFTSGATIATEGTHALLARAVDKAGNEATASLSLLIDKTKPVITISNVVALTKNDVTPAFTVSDAGAVTVTATATLDGAPFTSGSSVSAEGAHTLIVTATDAVGLSESVTATFTIDRTPPSIAFVENGVTLGASAALPRDAQLFVNAEDANGIESLAISADGNPFTSGGTIAGEGTHAISARAVDRAGNEATRTLALIVDKTPPVIVITNGGAPLESGLLTNEIVKPSFTASDASAVTLAATLDDAPFSSGTAVDGERTHTLVVTATDAVGLTATATVTFTIDRTAPRITFTSPAAQSQIGARSVIATGTTDDAVRILVNGVEALIDANAKTFTTPPIDLAEGENVLAALATDAAGNEGTSSVTVFLDMRAPALAVTAPNANACLDATQLEVRGTVSESGATVKVNGVDATVTGTNWSATLPVTEGALLLTIEARDAAGYLSVATRPLTIDRTAPVLSVTESGAPFAATITRRALAPLVRVADADKGATATVTLDGRPYSSGTPITNEGTFVLRATARDCAGHEATPIEIAFTIDRTPPVLTAIAPAANSTVGSMPRITGTLSEEATVAVEASGLAASVTGLAFTLDYGFAEGRNELALIATDRAGNRSRTPYTVSVRTNAPRVEIVENGAPIPASALFNRALAPVIRVDDPTATIAATLNGNPFVSGTAITADATYALTATATDSLGHTSAPAAATFAIDRTPPRVVITSPADGATLGGERTEVRGRAEGGDVAGVLVNGVAATLAGDGSFVATLPLDDGPNVIAATATDRAGNRGAAQIELTRTPGRLAILLTSPPDEMLTNRPTTVVAGQVLTRPASGKVSINGVDVPVDLAGTFRKADFALDEGRVAITAAVANPGGETNSVTVDVTADFTPPTLKVTANGIELADGARFATAPLLTVDATDNIAGGLATTLTIDGETIAGQLPALADGGHALSALARDAAGNETRVDRTFFVGTASTVSGCALSAIEPADGSAFFAESVRISGRSGGAAGVLIDGRAAAVADGSFCGEATLKPGRNEVTIRCADANGNPTADAPLTLVLYRYAEPEIVITAPAGGATIDAASVTVSGRVGDGISVGEVNGTPFNVVGGAFTVPNVSLSAGLNVIGVRAVSANGRAAVATTRVLARTGAPRIAITAPLGGAETGAASIDVSGTYAHIEPSTLRVNGIAATVNTLTSTTGTFTARVSLTGATTITASGTNGAGVAASASIDVRHVDGAPSIRIDAPADNVYVAAGTLQVTGSFSAADGATVQVAGVAATITGATFSADVPLGSASVIPIVARVTTPNGATATAAIRVHRFAAPPAVARSFPAADATDVDRGVAVVVLFTNAVDASTVAGAFSLKDANRTVISGDLFVDDDAITFAPHQPLRAGETYAIELAASLKDLAGGALAAQTIRFTTARTAPATAPIADDLPTEGCLGAVTLTGRASVGGARVRLTVDGVAQTTVASATGAFRFTFSFAGQSGYHTVRVRELGADGSMSPERALCFLVDCALPRVLDATLDRTAKLLRIEFSRPMNPATLILGGTIAVSGASASALSMNAANDVATITLADAPAGIVTLTVAKSITDAAGASPAADYAQTFNPDGTSNPAGEGKGFVSGAVYDATTGRPLPGASVEVIGGTSASTNERGRYSHALLEGAWTIRASAGGYTSVWRQVVVPAGAGVVPIDIRLTKRGNATTFTGAPLTLSHGNETKLTRAVELGLAAASLAPNRTVRLTSISAQSLAGLLPLGWSPLASAEIAIDDANDVVALPGAQLTFLVDATAIAAAQQTLSLVQYDPTADEWRVAVAVATIPNDGRATFPIDASGHYALVYPDRAAHLAQPPPARSGAPLKGVAPCSDCALTSRAFTLDPKQVLPSGRTVATLVTEGATQRYPSGTAVQAFIDEQLNLADGRVIVDPPFATDLLLYRTLAGDSAVAEFHLAPTSRAAAEMLRDGVDHIRIVDYPGRIERGTLIGAEGGRVPGDDSVTLDVPAGATAEPLHASVEALSIEEIASLGSIAGFRVAGGFTFTLTRTSEPAPADGVTIAAPSLAIPARAGVSVPASLLGPSSQVVIAEVLSATPHGLLIRLAALTSESGSVATSRLFQTRAIDSTQLPLDGIVRDGRYLILAAEAPVAFAFGQVRLGNDGLAIANARVTAGIGSPQTNALGVTDLSRTAGTFVIPIAAKPAAPFSLVGRSLQTGDGAVLLGSASPEIGAFVDVGVLPLTPRPPRLRSVAPDGGEVAVTANLVVTADFDAPIASDSVGGGITVTNTTTGASLPGAVAAAGNLVTFTATEPLRAAARYTITIRPTIRGANGAPFGETVVKTLTTAARPVDNTVRPDRISITIPDPDGRSTIRGTPGAVPANANLLAIRRDRFFIESYAATAANDGSFTFDAGHRDASDRISTDDDLELHVVDPGSRAVIAVVTLTPFVSADGRGFIAPVDRTVEFLSVDGIKVIVPAGAFDVPTPVRVLTSTVQPFESIPAFSSELGFSAGTRIEFTGRANKPLGLELPRPAGWQDPGRELMLGRLGQSIRGPRVEIVDTIRIADGRFTTAEEPVTAPMRIATNAVTGREAKKYLIKVLRSGIYAVVHVTTPVPGAWSILSSVESGVDFFWNHLASLYASDFYLAEGRGRIAIPVLLGTPFRIEGVDSATGFRVFQKEFPNADAGVFDDINPDVIGPYPVFVSPGRVEIVDMNVNETRVRGFIVKRNGTDVEIANNPNDSADRRVPPGLKVQALNPARGLATFDATVAPNGAFLFNELDANDSDRLVLIAGEQDVASESEISITFNEPIAVPETLAGLRERFGLRVTTVEGTFDVSGQAEYDVDSGGRRVQIAMASGHFVAGALYEVILRRTITDAAGNRLGQGVQETPTGPAARGGDRDLIVSFRVRAAQPKLGEFALRPADQHPAAALRDMTQYGNLLFVSALDGGILAYDLSDPTKLTAINGAQPKPFSFVPGNWEGVVAGLEEHWGIAADHHGRIYATGFTNIFGVLRSYRAEDFVKARTEPMCAGATNLPNALCTIHGGAVIGWRPGYAASLDLASGAVVSDRVEATPRKIQLLVQDRETEYSAAEFKRVFPHVVDERYDADAFEELSADVHYNPDEDEEAGEDKVDYLSQRVTVVNVTRDLRWSIDVPAHATKTISKILIGANDRIRVYRNFATYAVVTQFGHGIGVYDLNAIESNDAPNRPANWKPLREQIIITNADQQSACNSVTTSEGIESLTLSPEAAVVPSSTPDQLVMFAPEVRQGVLGVGVPLPYNTSASGTNFECVFRDPGMVLYDRATGIAHERLQLIVETLRREGRVPNPRYQSIAYYGGQLGGYPADYVLIAANDFGLIAFHVGPEASPFLAKEQLAGVIWIPGGAVAVRAIPRSHLATVVDREGYVYIVDVSKIDERWTADGTPTVGSFPTTTEALLGLGSPGRVGVDDPRIIWKSPEPLVTGTLPPIFDPETGILVAGDTLGTAMRVVPAIDPRLRLMINRGNGTLVETTGVTPLGIAPRAGFVDETAKDASAAAFRLEVTLPSGAARALEEAGAALRLAIESEFVETFATAQTPLSLPKAHLRTTDRDGGDETRATSIVLRRALPAAVAEDVRLQKGATRYVSDWIVPIADPRASEKWKWPDGADKKKAGCFACDRPDHFRGKTEQQGVFELWSAGRFITVRPDGEVANNVLADTPYSYLGRDGRLTARFTTIRGRKVRPTDVLVPAHNPPVADGMLQETHYLHSGEVETAALDLNAGGRAGVDVVVARTYRSRTIGGTEVGEGWDSPLYRLLLQLPNGDVEYHDGAGEIWKFAVDGLGSYVSPPGLFLRLVRTERGWTMIDQQWRIAEFNDRGQLVRESDEFYDATKPGTGNTIRYVYDESGRLERILDPLGRATTLTYENGRLKEASAEWRKRTVTYHHDAHGRLARVQLPGFRSTPGAQGYDYTGSARPAIQYAYEAVEAPSSDEPLQSQRYTDFAELSANLKSIRDPEQVARGLSGRDRVTFEYDLSTTPSLRDRNTSQQWATGETATFRETETKDVLGQQRTYTLSSAEQFDFRRHILSRSVSGVPLVTIPGGVLPDDVAPGLTGTTGNPLVTTYDYNEHGLETSVTLPSGLQVTSEWGRPAGAPGQVLISSIEKAPTGETIETKNIFDSVDLGTANVAQTGRRTNGGTFTFRSNPTPSRNRRSVATHDIGVESRANYDEVGQLSGVTSGEPGGEVSMSAAIQYYEESKSNPIESGRPRQISRGGGAIVFQSTYALDQRDEEIEKTVDLLRGVTTEIRKDVEGRVVSRIVTGSAGVLANELFGYNRDGRMVWHQRQQKGVGDVITTSRYDALGRLTGTTTNGSRVLLDPSSPGSDDFVSLLTKTVYNLEAREITDFDAHRDGQEALAARTTRKLDGLGRPFEIVRSPGDTVSPTTGSIRSLSLYDIHGQLAYASDGKRTASLTKHDAFGRPVETLLADGTRVHTAFSEWDEVVETVAYAKRNAPSDPLVEVARSRNVYSEQGRLQLTVDKVDGSGRSRGTGFGWTDGDALTSVRSGPIGYADPTFADEARLRAAETRRDTAGRVVSEIVGEAVGPNDLIEAANIFAESRVADYRGDDVQRREMREPRAARMTESRYAYDGLGRLTEMRDGGEAFITSSSYDEAGNVLELTTPGPARTSMHYDARGLMYREELPGGGAIRRLYDERGTLRQYVDEASEANVTFYDADALGRVWRIRYPDGTSEESRFENGTGVLLASRDRAGKWIWFDYDDDNNGRVRAEHHGGSGDEPSYAANPFTRYTYDDAGRVIRIAGADAAVEFDQFDLLGRPGITRSIRYRKTGCIPAAVECGSGLTSAPQIAEVYTQGHEWSVYDEERQRWRMPATGATLPATESESAWRNWIDESRDAAGNLVRQSQALTRTSAPIATLAENIARGVGRLSERTRGTALTTRFGYADIAAPDSAAPTVPVATPAPGPATGALGRAEVLAHGRTVAGTEIVMGAQQRVEQVKDLGLAGRSSNFEYDERKRLDMTTLLRRDLTNQPQADTSLTPAGFLAARRIDDVRHSLLPLLGASARSVVPLSWQAAAPTAGGQMLSRRIGDEEQGYTWTGGRRISDGAWTMSYDARDRLTAAESADRRITYDYDPNDRLVGRTTYQKVSVSEWSLETRTNVLARDGLPAATTFVWDPLVDRLVAVYDASAVDNGLLRQYLHGDEAYDDPLEVLITAAPGATPMRYLPILDEAGTGSLQAVTDGDGNLVERVLYADAYGDAPRYLHGAVVERIETRINGNSREITVTFSEPLDPGSTATGVRLSALSATGSAVRTFSSAPDLTDSRTLTWSVPDWPAFTADASRIQIAVTPSLRFPAWGTTPLQPAAPWEDLLGRAATSAELPFLKTVALAEFATNAILYDLPDLYLAARPESRSRLLFDFHALPLRDPATALVYVRARWYDVSTGSFLTADPMGYADASNLYAYAGNDPVNARDPRGEVVESAWDAASLALGGYQVSQWDEKTSLGTKALDTFGVFVDTVALITPFVPGGVGAAVRAYRAGAQTHDALALGRQVHHAIDAVQGFDQAANVAQGIRSVQQDFQHGCIGWGTVLNAAQTVGGLRSIGTRGVAGYKFRPVEISRSATADYGGAPFIIRGSRRAIDRGRDYEAKVADLYGGRASFDQRTYGTFLDNQPVMGVADNIARIDDENVLIEAKYVADWSKSIRNPTGPMTKNSFPGSRAFAKAERRKVLQQARKASSAFDRVIYHSNSHEFIAYYGRLFKRYGLKNVKFIFTAE